MFKKKKKTICCWRMGNIPSYLPSFYLGFRHRYAIIEGNVGNQSPQCADVMQKHLLLWSNRKTAGTQDPALVQGRDLLLLGEGRKITLIKDSHQYRAQFD